MRTEKESAIRMLVRRGVKPIDVVAEDHALMASVSLRNARGNISLKKKKILTVDTLAERRAARRAKLK